MARRLKVSLWDRFLLPPWRIIGEVESADDIPNQLPKRGAVLVVSGKRQKWIAFDCPCDSSHRILLNLTHPGIRTGGFAGAKRDDLQSHRVWIL